jgi:hypothetical protein
MACLWEYQLAHVLVLE